MENRTIHGLASAFDSPTFGEDGSFRLDKPVGSMSISPCGRDVVLASRQGLHIIDLDSPWAPPRHLPHHTPWEVADVQWSPFAARDYWVISTSNQKALVWNLAISNSQASIEHVLHAHTRAITDINFSAHHPDVLATCAVDSFIHCWDLRSPARPALTFCDWFAGATQVKWNRQDPHIVASSHDRFLRIWDDRKGAHPLRSIEAHSTKIYGVDWNRTSSNCLITCSLDKTIKFWDYSLESQEPDQVIKTPFPVWRARHTPFGRGVLAMPQRGNHDLHLYKHSRQEGLAQSDTIQPVHLFQGHQDQVKEFLWRQRGDVENGIDNREFQLVSWGADRILRLHRVDQRALEGIGYEKGKEVSRNLNFTRKNAAYKTFRDDPAKHGNGPKRVTSTGYSSLDLQNRVSMRSAISIGMSKAPIPVSVSLGNGAFMRSRPNANSSNLERKDIDPIAWMKGVKIGKREGLNQSISSTLSPNLGASKNWEPFESLGEEISQVGDRFSKVTFDKIDVQNRLVKLSLSGPWGIGNAAVFLQCHISFPSGYPNTGTPHLTIEKTATVDPIALTKIVEETQIITHAFLPHQRGVLESLIRYLQGEQTVQELTAWTKEDQESSSLELLNDESSSSDEEDDGVDGYNRVLADETGLSGSGLISSSISNANVPVPKVCGALWARNGTLVCFFPSRDKVSQSVLGSLGLRGMELNVKGHGRFFAGFGRLHMHSPVGKSKASTLGTARGGDSDSGSDSEDSYTSSSSSSSSASSKDPEFRSHRPTPPYAWRGKAFADSRIDTIIDESQNSSASFGLDRLAKETSKPIISIQNLEDLVPAKHELAQQYQITGSNSCEHNRKVANLKGNHDLADAWLILDMLLRKEVPLKVLKLKENEPAILTVAPRALHKRQKKGGVPDSPIIMETGEASPLLQMVIKWGQHPLGGTVLVKKLFSYFEQLGDIQTLAVLSCVLTERSIMPPLATAPKTVYRQDGIYLFHDLSETTTPFLPETALESSVDYFPSAEVALSLLRPASAQSEVLEPGKPAIDVPSGASSLGASNSDPVTPFSTGVTPPSSYIAGRRSLERVYSNSQSLSTSPEQLRHTHRSNSNLATTFNSFSRPFSFTASASSSPPNAYSRKRVSPVGSYAGVSTPSTTSGMTTALGRTVGAAEESKSIFSLQGSVTPHLIPATKKFGIKINLKNQDSFHNEGYTRVPLLDPNDEWQYRAYREAYAHLLSMWEMPIKRIEMLKYNSKTAGSQKSSTKALEDQVPSLISIGKKNVNSMASSNDKVILDIRRKCTVCTSSGHENSSMQCYRCGSCASREVALCCIFCAERIRGHAAPCLACGHAVHSQCRSAMLATSSPTAGEPTQRTACVIGCVIGCDCQCGESSGTEVEHPEDPPVKPSSPSTILEQDYSGTRGRQDDGDAWEDVAYESLAKNLRAAGTKYVKPKASQIWRGMERKQSAQGR